MAHHYAVVALLSTASALLPRLAPQQQRRAPVRRILDNSQDDPIARFERENDGGKRRPFLAYASRRRRRVAAEAPSLRASSREPQSRSPASRAGAKVFEKLVDYPCEFTIKVIGFDDETFSADMVRYIAGVVDKPADSIEFSKNDSKQKTYTSVTIKAPVASAEELYQCYAVLRQDPRVKIAL